MPLFGRQEGHLACKKYCIEPFLKVRTTFASRGFSVAAPAIWNSLPSGIRDSSSSHTFRRLLKTHCFQQAFGSPLAAHPHASDLATGWHCALKIFIYLLTYFSFGYWPDLEWLRKNEPIKRKLECVRFGAQVWYHCRISPPRFLAECRKRRLNQGSFVVLYFNLSALSDLH